jgi:hypothetical protein
VSVGSHENADFRLRKEFVLIRTRGLAGELAQELAFVHAVLERLAAVNEDDWDFIGELTAQRVVAIHVDFFPVEQAATLKLDQAFFYDLAKMTSFTGVNENLARVSHGGSVAVSRQFSMDSNVKNSRKNVLNSGWRGDDETFENLSSRG